MFGYQCACVYRRNAHWFDHRYTNRWGVNSNLTLSLWNGLFVHRDTSADVREKIISVAQETMALIGPRTSWQNGGLSLLAKRGRHNTRIARDTETLETNAMLE